MKQRFLLFLSALLLALPASAALFTFAPLPMEDPATVIRQFKPLLSYLGQQTGHDFRIRHSRDYGELLRRFRAGEIDLAYLGPLPYVDLKAGFGAAMPLVHFLEKSGQADYTCALISAGMLNTRFGKGNMRVALTQPLSTCGYLAANTMLKAQGADLNKSLFRYLGTHDDVALSLVRGDYDLGVVKTALARRYGHLGVRIIRETGRLPAFSLIVNSSRIPKRDLDAIRSALIALRPADNPADARITATWGENIRHGATPALDADFDSVRRMRGKLRIPEQGNF